MNIPLVRHAQQAMQKKSWPRRLPLTLPAPQTSLWFNLEVSARRYPAKAATLYCGQALSYAGLKSGAEALAGWLQSVGVGAGDRVAVFMQNCPQFLIAFYAINRANAVMVPVNPMNRAEELGHAIRDSGAIVLICSADLAAIVDTANLVKTVLVTRYLDAMAPGGLSAEVADDLGLPPAMRQWLEADPVLPAGMTAWAEALAAGLAPGPHTATSQDLALLPYTSGTTGMPKGCMHSNASLMANCCGGGLWAMASPESVGLAVVPMFHVTGFMYGVLSPVYQGMTTVIMPRWDRELAGRLISRHRVTHWTCIPTMIIDLFASPNCRSFDLSSLIYLSGGGAAMPEAVAQRLLDEFGLSFSEGYGLTETAAPSHGNPPERVKLQCLGMPIYGVDSRVVDPDTLDEMPVGEVGEIITHGPMVFQGYWRQPEASAAAFVEIEGKRFFRTGDLGRMDEEGYFFLTDRLKRMINASGYKVWPSEVELLLYKCPAVQEACIIAARDAYRGETVKAVVVLRAEARAAHFSGEDLITWARDHMAAYKVPKQVELVDSLPKSATGKVMWRLLQERESASAV